MQHTHISTTLNNPTTTSASPFFYPFFLFFTHIISLSVLIWLHAFRMKISLKLWLKLNKSSWRSYHCIFLYIIKNNTYLLQFCLSISYRLPFFFSRCWDIFVHTIVYGYVYSYQQSSFFNKTKYELNEERSLFVFGIHAILSLNVYTQKYQRV